MRLGGSSGAYQSFRGLTCLQGLHRECFLWVPCTPGMSCHAGSCPKGAGLLMGLGNMPGLS